MRSSPWLSVSRYSWRYACCSGRIGVKFLSCSLSPASLSTALMPAFPTCPFSCMVVFGRCSVALIARSIHRYFVLYWGCLVFFSLEMFSSGVMLSPLCEIHTNLVEHSPWSAIK